MEWSNAMVLEFISVIELEPVIWNPKHPDYKKKSAVFDAWVRISKKLSWKCSIEVIKKKRDSLMAYYRTHVHKLKRGDFKTNWFAFDALHSFLADVYDCTSIPNTEETIDEKEESLVPEFRNSETSLDQPQAKLLRREKRRERLASTKDRIVRRRKSERECELYAKLLAEKLLTFNEGERLTVMNKIDNLIYETAIRSRAIMSSEGRRKLESRSSYADDDSESLTHSDEVTRNSFEIEIKEELDDYS